MTNNISNELFNELELTKFPFTPQVIEFWRSKKVYNVGQLLRVLESMPEDLCCSFQEQAYFLITSRIIHQLKLMALKWMYGGFPSTHEKVEERMLQRYAHNHNLTTSLDDLKNQADPDGLEFDDGLVEFWKSLGVYDVLGLLNARPSACSIKRWQLQTTAALKRYMNSLWARLSPETSDKLMLLVKVPGHHDQKSYAFELLLGERSSSSVYWNLIKQQKLYTFHALVTASEETLLKGQSMGKKKLAALESVVLALLLPVDE